MIKLCSQQQKENSFFSWGFHIYDKWIQIKNRGGCLADYFKDNSITHVAIYGLGAIGKRLYEDLVKEQIKIAYGIDRNADKIHVDGLEIRTLDGDLPFVEAVIVTPISFYEIEKDIYQRMGTDTDIIFIEDMIEYCHKKVAQICYTA